MTEEATTNLVGSVEEVQEPQATQPAEGSSMVPNDPASQGAPQQSSPEVPQDGWLVTEGVPGTGEKPEWFNDKKYGSVYEQAQKAIKESQDMRKMLGAHTGSPEEYDIKLGEGYEDVEFDPQDPLLNNFIEYAKQNKMSQEGFSDAVKMFVDYSRQQEEADAKQQNEYMLAEKEKLGPDADKKLKEMSQWWKQNFPEIPVEVFNNILVSADTYEIVSKLRSKMGFARAPASQDYDHQFYDPSKLREMMADPKYLTDPQYREKVDRGYQVAYAHLDNT